MKILNIDKLAGKQSRELVIFDKKYKVESNTVGTFLENITAAEELAKSDSLVDQVNSTIDMILRSVPTLEREVLVKLELEQLQAIVAFVRGDEVEGATTVNETKKAGKKAAASDEGDAQKK